jgi:hypothetical protein
VSLGELAATVQVVFFYQFHSEVVFSDNSLVDVVLFAKNSRNCGSFENVGHIA